MTDVPKSMTAEEAARARADLVDRQLVPIVEGVFAKHGNVRSAAFCIAQFWDDEALDAVHLSWVFSELPRPAVGEGVDAEFEETDPVNFPSGRRVSTGWGDLPFLEDWDDNTTAIPLFAAFCREDCDQEMLPSAAFVPYATFLRDGDAAKVGSVEVVTAARRPWLDGVAPLWPEDPDFEPEYEDDVAEFIRRYGDPGSPGSAAGGAPAPTGGAPSSNASAAPAPRKRWWQRGR